MDNAFGWLIFIAVAAFLLRPLFAGFKQGMRGEEEVGLTPQAGFNAEVVGESNYQANLCKITGGKTRDGVEKAATATLVFENGNPYDRNAVRVDIEGLTVGGRDRELRAGLRAR